MNALHNPIKLRDWRGRGITAGFDGNGDLGLLQEDGTSIIVDERSIEDLYHLLKDLFTTERGPVNAGLPDAYRTVVKEVNDQPDRPHLRDDWRGQGE